MNLLRKHWKSFFAFFDVNNDGKISVEDAHISRNSFINLHALAGAKSSGIEEKFEKWWNTCVLRDVPGEEIPEDYFMRKLEDEFNNNVKHFINHNLKCLVEMFLIFDINSDNAISLNEYNKALHAFDYKYKLMKGDFFKAIAPNVRDHLPLNVIIDEWMRLMTEGNVSHDKKKRQATVGRSKRQDICQTCYYFYYEGRWYRYCHYHYC
jgi:hypothetical protein